MPHDPAPRGAAGRRVVAWASRAQRDAATLGVELVPVDLVDGLPLLSAAQLTTVCTAEGWELSPKHRHEGRRHGLFVLLLRAPHELDEYQVHRVGRLVIPVPPPPRFIPRR